MDYIKFINDNCNLTVEKKIALLNDLCADFGYTEKIDDGEGNLIDNISRKDYANERINSFIKDTVNNFRENEAKKSVEYEELVLEEK